MPSIAGLDRLKSQLLTSGIQQQNQALFQVINQLIDYLRSTIDLAATAAANSSGGGGQAATVIIQQLLDLGDSGGGGDDAIPIPGAVGPTGPAGAQGLDGPPGAILFLNEPEDADWFPPIQGPQGNPGNDGAQGPAGPPGFAEDGADGIDSLGASGLSQPPFVEFSGTVTQGAFQDTLVDLFNSQISLGVGDVLEFEVFGTVTNSTGATRLYEIDAVLGGTSLGIQTSAAIGNTAIGLMSIRGQICIMSTSLSVWNWKGRMSPTAASNTVATDVERSIWVTSATNFTGLQTFKLQIKATVTGASSSFQGGYYVIRRYPKA